MIYADHLTPFIFNWVNFRLTDVVLAAKHCLVCIPVGIAYTYINYKETLNLGKPIYFFATWEDIPKTSGIFVFLTILAMAWWVGMAKLTFLLKRKVS